jgi:uncharacterized OsmC-like protein
MITAKVRLTRAMQSERQFVAETGSGHHIILDDAAGGTGAKPIELVAVALAGCTAFDVITMLRQKHRQKVTGYEVDRNWRGGKRVNAGHPVVGGKVLQRGRDDCEEREARDCA